MNNQEKLVSILNEKNLILSVAESFTGGAVAKSIVSVSGASKVFYEGIVSYNMQSKTDRLSVSEETVKEYGVVSSKVAYEMALGLLKTKNCDVAIATTGYADKNDDDKIVGLAFIAVGYNGKIAVSKNVFDGDRERIIQKGSDKAIDMAIKILTDNDDTDCDNQIEDSETKCVDRTEEEIHNEMNDVVESEEVTAVDNEEVDVIVDAGENGGEESSVDDTKSE